MGILTDMYLYYINRCNDITPRPEADRLKVSGADDQDLSAQLHQTLTDLESDLTGE